jgi:transposase
MDAATPSRVAGLDWASRLHAVCVLEPDGQVRARFDVPHTGAELRGLTRRLVKLGVGQVAIERPDGPVVQALLAAGLEVVVIPGRQVKALRGRYGTAGNKDDRFDAYVLADALRTDGHRLVPLVPDAPQTTALRVVSRARKSLVATRVALANELRANLEIALPGAARLFSDVDSPIALAFLRRFPSVTQAAWLTEGPAWQRSCAAWATRAQGRSRAARASGRRPSRADRPRGRSPGHGDPGAGRGPGHRPGQIEELEGEVVERLGTHPDAAIFTALPRSGRVRAAALLAEIGDCRARFPDAESLTCLAGAAHRPGGRASTRRSCSALPATRSSGPRSWTLPVTPATTIPGPLRSTSRPELAAMATPTPSAFWPGPG